MAEEGNAFTGPLSNPTVRTIFIWGVAVNVLGRLLDPFLTQLSQAANAEHPERVLDPAELADMVIKGWMDQAGAEREAAGSGVNAERFAHMVDNTGEPPGLELLLEGYRRGKLPFDAPQGEPSVHYGIRTSRLRNEWTPFLEAMRYAVPGAAEVIDGALKAHLDDATARAKFSEAGLDPDADFEWMLGARGNPPGLAEVAHLVHRGIIPETGIGPDVLSFEQAVRESGYMNKWTQALFAGFTYVPPVRTIVALRRANAITDEKAAALFAENGVRPEDAAAYIAEAVHHTVAADKQLAKADVETLYSDGAIDTATAVDLLGALGYPAQTATWLLTLVDLRKEVAFLNKAINRVQSYYVARKIDKEHATDALVALKVPRAQIDELLTTWELERSASVRILTEAQIVDAWAQNILDQPAATSELVAIGYTPYDAWVLLSIKNKGPLPDPPAKGPASSGNIT